MNNPEFTNLKERMMHEPENPFRRYYHKHPDYVRAAVILVPLLGWWFIVSGLPMLFGFALGFFDWHNVMEMPKWNGIQNYISFFSSSLYMGTLWNAIWIGLLSVGVTQIIGFGAALIMNLPIRGKGFYRTIWYIPAVTAAAATTQIFNIWLDPTNIGVFNNVLTKFGLQPIVWQYSTFWMVFWIILYTAWRGIGASAILWLAGLQSVNPALYEAAKIDGANRRQCFCHVTIPGLRPFITFILITSCISAVQIYEPVLFISGGGPYNSTHVLMSQIFKDAFYDLNLGMAGAGATILALVIAVMVMINWITREKEEE